ncbi:hypothetical protein AUT26_08625 [[Arthrobacter] sp. ATCC 21022]|nr:hypothetical protein AUT26_08625 [Arthrobacter sp. ATCC 21022]
MEYEYLPEDSQALRSHVGDGQDLWGADWGASDLEPVRSRLKKFHMANESQRCVYCRQQIIDQHAIHWNIDHIVPKSVVPDYSYFPKNLALCCWGCNQAKGKADPRTRQAVKHASYPSEARHYEAYHPYFDEWEDHFYMDEDSLVIIPRKGSAKAKKTIEMCRLKRLAEIKAQLAMDAKESRAIDTMRELMGKGNQSLILKFIAALDDFSGSKAEFSQLVREMQITGS